MDVRIAVSGGNELTELESLQEWLADSAELRGRVMACELPPPPGALGPVLDAILVALAPGSVATAGATAVVSWLRHRAGGVRVEIELPDGRRLTLAADRVRELTDAQLRGQLADLLTALAPAADAGAASAVEPDQARSSRATAGGRGRRSKADG